MPSELFPTGLDPFQAAGLVGFVLYVLNYALLSFNILDSRAPSYFGLNILAASLVLVSLSVEFNLASAMIQIFWIAIGAAAIGLRVMARRRGPGPSRRA